MVLHSRPDSGASWQQLTTLPVDSLSPASVQFVPNSNTAILTSDMGVYRTTDLGATWSLSGSRFLICQPDRPLAYRAHRMNL